MIWLESVGLFDPGLLAPLPGGWVLVKDAQNVMWWVHEQLGEVAPDPPNLDEMRERFQNIKKKSNLMASRTEEEKDKARRKILGRNLAENLDNGSLPPPDKKKNSNDQPRLKDEYHSPGRKPQKSNNLNKAVTSPLPSKGKVNEKMVFDEVFEQTTDPKIKRGTMEQSLGDLDQDFGGLDADFLDDDPYKYTKSTLKKGHDDLNSPYMHSKKKRDLLAGERAIITDLPEPPISAEISLENHRKDMPILEIDLDLGTDEDFGERIQGDFITPSGKKYNPKTATQSEQPKRSKAPPAARKEEPIDSRYSMVDSNMLEKMINDINHMQMKVSQIEQENADLKRKNVDIVSNQKKLREQTKTAIENTKNQLNEKIVKRENRLEELVKEELKKTELGTMDQSKANLNILKDIQDMKNLLEQSVLKNNQIQPQETKADFQPNLPMVDSHVFGQGQGQPASQNIQHSFGAEFARPPLQPGHNNSVNPNSSLYNQTVPGHYSGYPGVPQRASGLIDGMAGSRVAYGQGFKGERESLTSGGGIGSSQTGAAKWLHIILTEKSKMSSLKSRLQSLKLAVQAKAIEVANFEQDMNIELQRLGLPQGHSLVKKLRSNIKQQAKDYKHLVKEYENEKGKYRLTKNGINMLERTLLFVQNAGGITKEADKHLEEVYSSFKNLAHFSKSEDNKDLSFNSSESRSQSIDVSHSDSKGAELDPSNPQEINQQEILQNVNMGKKDVPTEELVVKPAQTDTGIIQVPNPEDNSLKPDLAGTFTETIELKPSNIRQSKTVSKTGYYAKGSYINELNKVNGYLAKGSSSFSMEPDFAKLRDSLGYQPLSRTSQQEPATDNMKRYFQTQARWYSDMRNEVNSAHPGAQPALPLLAPQLRPAVLGLTNSLNNSAERLYLNGAGVGLQRRGDAPPDLQEDGAANASDPQHEHEERAERGAAQRRGQRLRGRSRPSGGRVQRSAGQSQSRGRKERSPRRPQGQTQEGRV